MKIDIKCRFDGKVLFSFECANNTTALTLQAAVRAGANLSGANLSSANLSSANLSSANLSSANLSSANLSSANLSSANLSSADLRSAGLYGAGLYGANLSGANLSSADLRSANLSGANLSSANLSSAKNAELAQAQTVVVPDGNIVGWKKCGNGAIVKLSIPEAARRSNATGRKCRAEYADVLEVFGAEFGVTQTYGPEIVYRAGERVHPDSWDDNRWNECSHGIHFFITREEAEDF